MNLQSTFVRARNCFTSLGILSTKNAFLLHGVRYFKITTKNLAENKESVSTQTKPPTLKLFQRLIFGNEYKIIATQIYEKTVVQSERTDLWKALQLTPNFHNWFEVTLLHLWMVSARLRFEGKEGKKCSDFFSDLFWKDAEKRMMGVGLTNPSLLSKESKGYSKIYYGALVSYDEALLFKSDTLLAEALWRNVFGMQRVPTQTLAALVQYVRKEMFMLDKKDAKLTLLSGSITWGDPVVPKN